MQEDKKAKNKKAIEEPSYEDYPDISNIASASECTGMMHAPPQNEAEEEAYQELSSMQIPKKKKE